MYAISLRNLLAALAVAAGAAYSSAALGADWPTVMDELEAFAASEYPELRDLYVHLHQNPELSFHEDDTSAMLAKEFESLGFDVTTNVGGHGVVGVLKNGEGPTVMVRADMDALPVEEETGLPYASQATTTNDQGQEVAVMHACGHDVHMTSLVGTSRFLANHKNLWQGTLMVILQPAEERGAGAKAMLEDGLFERFPRPDYALALHVDAGIEAGKIGVISGFAMANVDSVDIRVRGVGGHGAYPHLTIDPVVIAARIVLGLQTIVSREISPIDPAVVTVGSIHGGTKHNIIGNAVDLQLTVRSYKDEVRDHLLSAIERIAIDTAKSARVPEDLLPIVEVRDEYTPALYNSPELVDRTTKIFEKVVGEDNIVAKEPVMGGEDFGRYGRTDANIPIFMFRLGAVPAELMDKAESDPNFSLPGLHSSRFAPKPEPTIKTGVKATSAAVIDLMRP